MKHFLYILLFCCSCGYGQSDDYVIVNKALEQLDHIKQLTILRTPNNFVISLYLDGFEIKGVAHLKTTKFSFNASPVHAWEANQVYLAKAMAWSGLQNTAAFNTLYPVSNPERFVILRTIATEQNGVNLYDEFGNPYYDLSGNQIIKKGSRCSN